MGNVTLSQTSGYACIVAIWDVVAVTTMELVVMVMVLAIGKQRNTWLLLSSELLRPKVQHLSTAMHVMKTYSTISWLSI